MLIALWPRHWSRQQRSNATLVAALVLMVVMLALLGQILSLFPEPIGSNAQAFSDGARTTLWLTLISGTVGLILGTAAALARTARWIGLRWLSGFYIWAIRGTPLLVQILFVYFALPVLVPGLNLPDFAAAVVARMMGLPIDKLIVATNENDVLDEFFRTGVYRVRATKDTHETSSPSMDISKASNFERFVFDLLGRDAAQMQAVLLQHCTKTMASGCKVALSVSGGAVVFGQMANGIAQLLQFPGRRTADHPGSDYNGVHGFGPLVFI